MSNMERLHQAEQICKGVKKTSGSTQHPCHLRVPHLRQVLSSFEFEFDYLVPVLVEVDDGYM